MWGRRKLLVSLLELAHHVFVDYLVGDLVELQVPGVRHFVVECQAACRCQGWKVAECFPPCCRLQHDANTDSFRHKSLLRKLNLIKKILLLKEILSDGAGNTRPNWNAWLLQTNLISTVLNTKLWNRPCGCTIEGPPCFNAEGPDTALLDLPLPEPGAKGRITVQEAAEVSLTNIERVISYVK